MNRAIWVLLASVLLGGCRLSANFHEIDPGKFYRSAQLTEAELRESIDRAGIRTIINLRGSNPGSDWYDAEARVARERGVRLVDIGMSAKRLPHRADLLKLLDAYREAERPLLVHCLAGADRTGEAAAIYQMEYMNKAKDDALEMLTLKYLHFAPTTPAKRYFIGLYQGREWAYRLYDPCATYYEHYDQRANCSGLVPTGAFEEDSDELIHN